KLLPGHYLLAERGRVRTECYWDVGDESPLPADARPSPGEYAERVVGLLDDSVQLRMIADVPVGAFLSGGVDSSTVVALLKRHATGPVKPFPLGFTVGGPYNEFPDARRVAEALGTEHHELLAEDVDLVETLQTLVYHFDEPFGDDASFPVYLLS